MGGRRLYGYTTGSVPTIVADEAERIRGAAQAVIEGRSLSSIVREWNAEGVTTSTGSKWSQPTLSQMLNNRAYNGRTTLRGEDHGPGNWKPILDDDLFAAVGTILSDPSRTPKKLGATYPLVGVLRCGTCGKALGSMPTRVHGKRVRRYGCRAGHGTILADTAEEYVYGIVPRYADHPRVGRIIRDAEGNEDAEAAALRVGIAEDNAKLANLADLVADGTLTPDAVRKASGTLRNAIAEREVRLSTLGGRSALDRFAGRVVADWDSFSPEDQRSIILSLVTGVRVNTATHKRTGSARQHLMWKVHALAAIDWDQVEPTAEDIEQWEADQRLSDAERDADNHGTQVA